MCTEFGFIVELPLLLLSILSDGSQPSLSGVGVGSMRSTVDRANSPIMRRYRLRKTTVLIKPQMVGKKFENMIKEQAFIFEPLST